MFKIVLTLFLITSCSSKLNALKYKHHLTSILDKNGNQNLAFTNLKRSCFCEAIFLNSQVFLFLLLVNHKILTSKID